MSSPTVLFRNQVFDNVFRSCVFGCTFWTACEVLDTWGAANTWWPYLSPARHPVPPAALLFQRTAHGTYTCHTDLEPLKDLTCSAGPACGRAEGLMGSRPGEAPPRTGPFPLR